MVGQAHRLAARVVLGGLLLFAVYHLVRDVATTFFGVHVGVVDVAHRAHAWCRPVCDYVTMPLELFNIVTIAIGAFLLFYGFSVVARTGSPPPTS